MNYSAIFLTFISLLVGFPIQAQQTAPCESYLLRIAGELADAQTTDLSGCSDIEAAVIASDNWSSFVQNYGEIVSHGSYQKQINQAALAEYQGDPKMVFVHLDMALATLNQIFAKIDDPQRAAFYVSMTTRWRNSALEGLGVNTRVVSQIDAEYEYAYESYAQDNKLALFRTLRCAIRFDAYSIPFSDLLNSKAFTDCFGGE